MQSHSIAKSCPNSTTFSSSRAYASPLFGKRELRFQDEARHAYSSQESRSGNLAAPQNQTLTVSHSQVSELLRAPCLASGIGASTNEAFHAYSSMIQRPCKLTLRKIITKQFLSSQVTKLLTAVCLACGSGASRMRLAMRTAERYCDPEISQHRKIRLSSFIFPSSRAFASPVLGKRKKKKKKSGTTEIRYARA